MLLLQCLTVGTVASCICTWPGSKQTSTLSVSFFIYFLLPILIYLYYSYAQAVR